MEGHESGLGFIPRSVREGRLLDISCQQALTAKRHRLTYGDGEHG